MASLGAHQGRKAAMPWLIQEPAGRCSGQGTGSVLWPRDITEPEETGCAQFRCCCIQSIQPAHFSSHSHSPQCFAIDSCRVLCAVLKRSTDARASLATCSRENVWPQSFTAGNAAVQHSSALFANASCVYSAPYSACSVQTARRLLPGQPLPLGVVAFGMAMPALQGE